MLSLYLFIFLSISFKRDFSKCKTLLRVIKWEVITLLWYTSLFPCKPPMMYTGIMASNQHNCQSKSYSLLLAFLCYYNQNHKHPEPHQNATSSYPGLDLIHENIDKEEFWQTKLVLAIFFCNTFKLKNLAHSYFWSLWKTMWWGNSSGCLTHTWCLSFFSTGTIFGSIFLHTKARKSRQNRFRDRTV